MISNQEFVNITRSKFNNATKNPRPFTAGFFITKACNLRCKLCGVGAGEPLDYELPTEEVFKVVDNMAEAGLSHISFSGGEPTVRKDFFEVINYASKRIRSIGVVTNGLVVDREYARKLVLAGAGSVMVSLDGAKAETHDFNRGEGSYEKAIQAIKNCQSAGVGTVRTSFTISRTNYHELQDIIKLTLDLGIALQVQEFAARGRGAGREDLVLTRRMRRDMQRLLYRCQVTHGLNKFGFENCYIVSEDMETQKICTDSSLSSDISDFCVGCLAGIYSFFLNSDGTMKLCGGYAEGILGDLKEQKLSDIWRNSEILHHIRNRDDLKGRCGSCTYRYICGGCRINAYLINRSVKEEDPACWTDRKESELDISY
jgi:radical SAM protein with 4Fe4S-binding SPASM domain